jgi:hypothetical protein
MANIHVRQSASLARHYLRGRIGERRWRVAHRFIALGLLLGIPHTVGAGDR